MKKKILTSRIPTYLGVYNSLYTDIVNGVYVADEFLPSETSLAETYGVSRNTLRQALAILNEDGLISKSQGKGTLVHSVDEFLPSSKFENPLLEQCKKKIDQIDVDYNFGSPTDIAMERLQLTRSDLVLAGTSVYRSEKETMGYSFIQIPTALLPALEIDISREENIEKLLNKTIFNQSKKVVLSIKVVYANEMEAMFLEIPEEEVLLHMEVILLDGVKAPIARCKFYFKPNYYTLKYASEVNP